MEDTHYYNYMMEKDIRNWEEKHGSKIYSRKIIMQFNKCSLTRRR